jgi:hypothetical protein
MIDKESLNRTHYPTSPEARQKTVWDSAPEGTLPAKVAAGLPLTPGERLLAVTLLGLPVSKDAA